MDMCDEWVLYSEKLSSSGFDSECSVESLSKDTPTLVVHVRTNFVGM